MHGIPSPVPRQELHLRGADSEELFKVQSSGDSGGSGVREPAQHVFHLGLILVACKGCVGQLNGRLVSAVYLPSR